MCTTCNFTQGSSVVDKRFNFFAIVLPSCKIHSVYFLESYMGTTGLVSFMKLKNANCKNVTGALQEYNDTS
jgi:hypothetical protein